MCRMAVSTGWSGSIRHVMLRSCENLLLSLIWFSVPIWGNFDEWFESVRLPWIAPECYGKLSSMTRESDIYAFGITLWEMYSTGKRPYEGFDRREVIFIVICCVMLERHNMIIIFIFWSWCQYGCFLHFCHLFLWTYYLTDFWCCVKCILFNTNFYRWWHHFIIMPIITFYLGLIISLYFYPILFRFIVDWSAPPYSHVCAMLWLLLSLSNHNSLSSL